MKGGFLIGFLIFAVSGFQAKAEDLEGILRGAEPVPSVGAEAGRATKMSPLAAAVRKKLGTPTSEQNIFLRYLNENDWGKAALQFPRAFEGTAFQKSSTGRALFGLTLFRAGLGVKGVQTLFLADRPKEIGEILEEEWRTSAPVDHYVWTVTKVPWNKDWESVFGLDHGLQVKGAELLSAPNPKIEELEKLSAQAGANSLIKGRLDWQIVLNYALKDQADKAALVLARLMKNTQAPVSKDLMQLTAARLLFQNGYFESAIKYYEKVSKNSEYWPESQEEIAWAYIRKGEPQNARAVSESLVLPGLNYLSTQEAFFIRALSQLKVCDYPGVMAGLQVFPKRFKERTLQLEKLSVDANTAEVNEGLVALQKSRIRIEDLGKNARNLPRRFSHDELLYGFAQTQKHLENEAAAAEKLYAQSLALTGLQGVFEVIRNNSLQLAQSAKGASFGRVKELAAAEVAETKDVLRKLHIVEAEVIQQASTADKIVKNLKAGPDDTKIGVTGYSGAGEKIKFPAEDEVWFDEVSQYRVDVKKACTVKR